MDIAVIYRLEVLSNLSGGLRKRSEILDNLDLRVAIDAEKLLGARGLSFFFYGLANHGGRPSLNNIGDYQVASNIEAPHADMRLYEAWVQKLFNEDKMSILFGLHDLNSEFYVTDSATLFYNSSFGVGNELAQTGENGPSIFPFTAPALRLRAEPSKDFYLQSAVFSARSGDRLRPNGTYPRLRASDGFLFITEAAYLRGKLDDKSYPGKYAIGAWTYTRTFDSSFATYSGGEPAQVNNSGVYLMAEQSISEKTVFFARYGYANPKANFVSSNWSAGFVFTGLIPTREKDRFGLGVSQVNESEDSIQLTENSGGSTQRNETAYELNYRLELLRGIVLQPAFQYIAHPGINQSLENAQVAQLRLELTL